jgi:hypothetical protein
MRLRFATIARPEASRQRHFSQNVSIQPRIGVRGKNDTFHVTTVAPMAFPWTCRGVSDHWLSTLSRKYVPRPVKFVIVEEK